MASFIESQPVFESRLKASGLTTAIYDKFKAQDIVSLSQLAFISSYTPGGADEAPLIAVFEKVIEREASVAERASFRRLFHAMRRMQQSPLRCVRRSRRLKRRVRGV